MKSFQSLEKYRDRFSNHWKIRFIVCGAVCLMALGGWEAAVAAYPVADDFNPGANEVCRGFAEGIDGRLLVYGDFSEIAGGARLSFGQLNPDGTLVETFDPHPNNSIFTSLVLPDGKFLVGGRFSRISGVYSSYTGVARLNWDGSVDTNFAGVSVAGPNFYVTSLLRQPDGKILVAGCFTSLCGQAATSIGRLNADGTLDEDFQLVTDGLVFSMDVQSDGKIVMGGLFTTLNGQACQNIGRINTDGTPDAAFSVTVNSEIDALVVQPDGKILLAGYFTNLCGETRNRIGRLNADGSLDESFDPNANSGINTLVLQTDGTMLIGGSFSSIGGVSSPYIAKLNADGTLDTTYDPDVDGDVTAVVMQKDGRVLMGGFFGSLGGEARLCAGRLYSTGTATQSLVYSGTTLTWLRSGTMPELSEVLFVHTADNGETWSTLGTGAWRTNGWELAGVSVSGGTIRAYGYAAGGWQNSSRFPVSAVWGAPLVVIPPQDQTVDAGSSVRFCTVVESAPEAVYQWRKDGTNLVDGEGVSGVASSNLTLSGVLRADAGAYDVVVSNVDGVVTSRVAILTVNDPAILVDPADDLTFANGRVVFTVAAGGTGIGYQWYKDGTVIAGATGSSLVISHLQAADIAGYFVVVTGLYGSVTSRVAEIEVSRVGVDASFNPGANSNIYGLAVGDEGRVVLSGVFTNLGGVTHRRVAEIYADGTVNTGFQAGLNDYGAAVGMQRNGRIVVGGGFTTMNDCSQKTIGRFYADGSWDPSYAGYGYSSQVYAVSMQVNSNILLGGAIYGLYSVIRRNIALVDTFGRPTAFNPDAGSPVYSVAVDTNGNFLAGGRFPYIGGASQRYVARLHTGGSADTNFVADVDGPVQALAIQANGKILIAGAFTNVSGGERPNLARLNEDGSLDYSFKPALYGDVKSIVLQADGGILIGGSFTNLCETNRSYLARLNADGTLDEAFNPAVDGPVYALALQADGSLLAGGEFQTLFNEPRQRIARLTNTDPARELLTYQNERITWLRGGTAPEIYSANFEYSTNGVTWTNLGSAVRRTGGWEMDLSMRLIALRTGGMLRAWGHTASGYRNGSCGFVDSAVEYLTDMPGRCLELDGRSNYVRVADADGIDLTNAYTIEAWFRPRSFTPQGGLVSKYQSANDHGYFVRLHNTPPYTGLAFDGLQTVTGLLQSNAWYHVAAVKDGDSRRLYLNGVEQVLTGTVQEVTNNWSELRLGSDYSGRFFDGWIDEVRLWKVARSREKILDAMHRELTGQEANLAAYYPCDAAAGTCLSDRTGHGYDGVLCNMTETAWVDSTIPCRASMSTCSNLRAAWFSQTNTSASSLLTLVGWNITNGAYRVIGHDGGALNANTSDKPPSLRWRLNRTWRFDGPGAMSGSIQIDCTSITGLITDVSLLRLLPDSNNVFADATYALPGTYQNNMLTVSGITPAETQYFTLGEKKAASVPFYVDASKTNDSGGGTSWATAKKTIQAAINRAVDGDVVWVSNGVYDAGGLVTPGYALTNRVTLDEAITVRSVNGPSDTVIVGASDNGTNGPSAIRCVWMSAGVLEGFTLSNGYTRTSGEGSWTYDQAGGGLWIGGGALFSNGVIMDCSAAHGGGIKFSYGGSLVDSTIERCRSTGQGGGAYFDHGGVSDRCVISNNFALGSGGGFYGYYGGEVRNGLIVGNAAGVSGGGVGFDHGGYFAYCTITENTCSNKGGGLNLYLGGTGINSIVYFNTAEVGGSNWSATNGWLTFVCTTPTGGLELCGGTACLTNDPQFTGQGDYRLSVGSPCIDAGTNLTGTAGDLVGMPRPLDGDADGVARADLGCYEKLNAAADSDGDIMADGWELDYGFSPIDPADALQNADDDALDNQGEFVADTDPTDSASCFLIENAVVDSQYTVHFNSSTSRIYRLYGITNLISGGWNVVPGEGPRNGVGGSDAMSDTNEPPIGPYYRLKVSLP